MQLNALLYLLSLLIFQSITAQQSQIQKFGEPLREEFALEKYTPDPEASGVVLYERGNYTIDELDGYIKIIKEVHKKIKVFDAKNFNYANVEIPYYRQENVRENVTNLKAITHNGQFKEYVASNAVFEIDDSQFWSHKKFTFPNVKDGSILEYTYQIESPYFLNFGSWSFMNELPTLYSELHTEIPGNFIYNRTLYGDRKLDIDQAEIKKGCFHLSGFKVPGDCESATYMMKNVPAYYEEKHMLSPRNYMPALKFELVEIIDLDESYNTFAKTWKDLDKRFKNDKDLGRQTKYSSVFKEKLPTSMLSISNDLERAKSIYYYIQKSINWNGQTRDLKGIRVKEAFEEGVGNSTEINLALINALEAANIESQIMLLATRERALPSKQYPVLTDFNYVVVFLKIGKEKYILDATDKYTPFGILPFRALNVEGRVLDFKNGSYWEPITPMAKNMHYVNMQLRFDEKGILKGEVKEVSTGYISVQKRKSNNDLGELENIKQKQKNNEFLNISKLVIENATDLEQPYKENYDISLYQQSAANQFFLYPFIMQRYFSESPFKKDIRKYPIDFGFPIINNYLISIDVADQYQIIKVPENKIMRLPENDGELSIVYDTTPDKVNIRLSVKLNTHSFPAEAYQSLREFFAQLIKIQSEEPIIFQKM